MNVSKRTALLLTGLGLAVGTAGAVGISVFAQQAPATTSPVQATQTTTTPAQAVIDPQDSNDKQDAPDANVALPAGGISETQARAAIATAYPSVTIQRIELEDNNGAIVYGAKLSDKTEVTVDAKTGAVAKEAADQETTEHANNPNFQKDTNDAAGQSGQDNQKDGETNDDATPQTVTK